MKIKFVSLSAGVVLLSTGCATRTLVYKGPGEAVPHASIIFEKNYMVAREAADSKYADEGIFAQSVVGNTQGVNDSGKNCESHHSITALNKLKKKKTITVAPDKPFQMRGISMYGYGRRGAINAFDGNFRNFYRCDVISTFTPMAGKDYVVRIKDEANAKCSFDIFNQTDKLQVTNLVSDSSAVESLTEGNDRICQNN